MKVGSGCVCVYHGMMETESLLSNKYNWVASAAKLASVFFYLLIFQLTSRCMAFLPSADTFSYVFTFHSRAPAFCN